MKILLSSSIFYYYIIDTYTFDYIIDTSVVAGSQAVSSTNLSNDDTLSIRSMSVDDTPDFDRTMDYAHFTRTKSTVLGLKSEITELRNDISELKNDIVESKNELNDASFDRPKNDLNDLNESFDAPQAKTPILTPGSRSRINPFLRDCEGASDQMHEGQLVDPLGALPVETHPISTSPTAKVASPDNTQVNGDTSHDTTFGKSTVFFFCDTVFFRANRLTRFLKLINKSNKHKGLLYRVVLCSFN